MNITNIPDERLEELFAPLSYKGFLQSMSYFHGYSWRNIFLIYKQMPHATKLAEYDGWKQFGRKVKRGSKTIKILAPIPQEARTKLIEKIDTETGKAILDENGKRVMEEQIIPVPPKFEEKRVLDISQTYGEPVFRFAGDVLANDFLRDASIDALKKVLGGEFETPRNVLSIIRELSQTMETSALTDDWKTLITESVSFVIGKRFGAEEIAAPVLPQCDVPYLEEILEKIRYNANTFIVAIETFFKQICEEKELEPMTVMPEIVTEQPPIMQEEKPSEPPSAPPPKSVQLLPDTEITIADRNAYGYTRPELLPLTRHRALSLFKRDLTIYLLFSDNCESMVFYIEEIEKHEGLYGVPSAQWQNSREFIAISSGNPDAIKEARFIYDTDNHYAIFQIKSEESEPPYKFMEYEKLEEKGHEINRTDYTIAHTDALPASPSDTPEGLFMWFNGAKPKGYNGRSLTVSDILSIHKNGVITSYYCNGRTYKNLISFLGFEGIYEGAQNSSESDEDVNSVVTTNSSGASSSGGSGATPQFDVESSQEVEPEITEMPLIMPETYYNPAAVNVCKLTAEQIRENRENSSEFALAMQDYQMSRDVDSVCANEIDELISKFNKGNGLYNLRTPAEILLQKYGKDRLAWVLSRYFMLIAPHVLNNPKGNLVWMQGVLCVDDNGNLMPFEPLPLAIKTHPSVVDALAKQLNEFLQKPKRFDARLAKAKRRSKNVI